MDTYSPETWAKIRDVLQRPFDQDEVKSYTGSGSAFSYITARQAAIRFDEAVGPQGWSDSYLVVDHDKKAVECTITIGGVSKSDVGYPNADVDKTTKKGDSAAGEEPLKSSYSDAFKRAAVKWGVGRHLYGDPVSNPTLRSVRAILSNKDDPRRPAVREHIVKHYRALASLDELQVVPHQVLQGALDAAA